MLFASTELVARIERAECKLLTDGASAVSTRDPNADVCVEPVAGGVAIFAVADSPLNKVAGLGFEGPLEVAELERIEQVFDARRAPVQVELSILAVPSIGKLLTSRGYELVGFENVLGLSLPHTPPSPVPSDITIDESALDELDTWIDVAVTGFATPDTQGLERHEEFPRDVLEQAIGGISAAPGFRRYMARRGGEPVGSGSMRTFDGVAQLCGAATLPAHRRRGVQSALLHRRLAVAGQEGCDVAVVTTQPGSKSHQNVQRQGFELLYTRAVLVREPRS